MTSPAVPADPAAEPRSGPGVCRICGGRANIPVLAIDENWRLVRCRDCGVVLEEPLPAPEQLEQFYSAGSYAPQRGKLPPGLDAVMNWLQRRRLRFLPERRGRLLDYGSGKGRFLRVAKDAGWDVAGYEPIGPRAEYTEDRYGIRVYGGPMEDLPAEVGDLDAVTMFHVLEHVTDPMRVLAEVRRRLADDGRIVIALPNFDSWQSRFGGLAWLHLHAPWHLQHFTKRSLRRALGSSGFRVVAQSTYMAESNIPGWFMTIVNRATGTDELLFRLLKRVWVPRSRRDWKALLAVLGLSALLGLALPLLALLAAVETACGAGAVLFVAAEKDPAWTQG